MNQPSSQDYTQPLRVLMQQAGLNNFKALYATGVSRKQIRRLRQGNIQQVRVETLIQLSQVLQVSISDLLQIFCEDPSELNPELTQTDAATVGALPGSSAETDALRQEYQRLQQKLQQQRQILWEEFQQTTIQTLESLLLQWPTAAAAARKRPDAPAIHLLPLLRPLEQLLANWNVEMIGQVGEEIPYHPQWHQLQEGTSPIAVAGETRVKVTHVGYRQGDRLLYRAKVMPIAPPER